jgi:hypothetical protein
VLHSWKSFLQVELRSLASRGSCQSFGPSASFLISSIPSLQILIGIYRAAYLPLHCFLPHHFLLTHNSLHSLNSCQDHCHQYHQAWLLLLLAQAGTIYRVVRLPPLSNLLQMARLGANLLVAHRHPLRLKDPIQLLHSYTVFLVAPQGHLRSS